MNFNFKSRGTVTVNGKTYSGNNVSINNGDIYIDGNSVGATQETVINITVNGDIDSLENTCGEVNARNVGKIKTTSGDINCGDVNGNINTVSGDVRCRAVMGDVETISGDIKRL